LKSVIRFFSSVKLAILLLILITVASILGTLIPQHRSQPEYAAMYGQLSNILIKLQFTRLYQSWWYAFLLLLFSINISICTLTRITHKLKRAFHPTIEKEKKRIQALKIHKAVKSKDSLESLSDSVRTRLSAKGYKVRSESAENAVFLTARKRTLGLFGSDIVHLGLLVIIAGGLISSLGGFRTSFTIFEGEVLDVPRTDFRLRMDKFETEFYPSGSVKDWKSTLTVIENGHAVLTETIEVNHPLSYRGFVFYQSRYGTDWKNMTLEIWVKKKKDSADVDKLKIKLGRRVKLKDKDMEIAAVRFVPDFGIDADNQVVTRSMEPNNPAVFINGYKKKEKVFSGWIFAKYPDFDRIHSGAENGLSFQLKGIEAPQFSGIQMAKDPGVNFVWVGCGFLMFGLFIAFFWTPREVKCIIEKHKGKTEIFAGGIAAKNRDEFQSEFMQITEGIGRLQ